MTITTYPDNCVSLLEVNIPGAGGVRGSGVIIGPQTILTASHVLWDADANAGASKVDIYPGYNASSVAEPASGQLTGREVWHYYKVADNGHVLTASASQYAFAIVDTSHDLSSYGSFGTTSGINGGSVEASGYPAAHQHIQYKIDGTVSSVPNLSVWKYSNFSSTPGYSGGPLWINKGTAAKPLPYVVGVVSTTLNACRLTTADLNTIKNWQNSDAYLWNGTSSSQTRNTDASNAQTLQTGNGDMSGQTFYSSTNYTFIFTGNDDTFVFTTGFGHDKILSFDVAGQHHAIVSLPASAEGRLANIITNGITDSQGDTTLHLGNHDAITIAGVSVSQLLKHQGDFTFHV